MIKLTAMRRDFIFLVLLVVMVRVAFQHQKDTSEAPILYAAANHHPDPFQHAEKDTTYSRDIYLSLGDNEPFFHPPDKHVMYQIDSLFDQLTHLITSLQNPSQEMVELKGMRERILYLKRKYQHTSPAILLLGPIGSTGVVLQEQELEKELLKNAHRLGVILTQLINDDEEFEAAKTIDAAIENNRLLLSKLQKEEPEERS